VVLGALMIVVGVLALTVRVLRVPDVPFSAVWPVLVLFPGVLLFAAALAIRRLELAIPGAVVTVVGLLLAYQNATGHWRSWAYAWALVVPVAIGIAQLAIGLVTGDRGLVRTAGSVLMVGLGLFAVGMVVFEGLIGLSGWNLGVFGGVGVPVLLILFGAALVLRRGRDPRE
jgi:hypothetical protein